MNEDSLITLEPDDNFNEDYYKWCYGDGDFVYASKDMLLDYLENNMPNSEQQDCEIRRVQFDAYLSPLKHWK